MYLFQNADGALTLKSVAETSAFYAAISDNQGRINNTARRWAKVAGLDYVSVPHDNDAGLISPYKVLSHHGYGTPRFPTGSPQRRMTC
ncbi:hypothetical protein [Ruegeria arenilitoris]|uniref:hypothetical protein n=1 Tax=Ruegeria arenilitoris TaxID=1173585 RepID=UPI003463E9BA